MALANVIHEMTTVSLSNIKIKKNLLDYKNILVPVIYDQKQGTNF